MTKRLPQMLVPASIELTRDRPEHKAAPIDLLAVDGANDFRRKGHCDTGIWHDLHSQPFILKSYSSAFPVSTGLTRTFSLAAGLRARGG